MRYRRMPIEVESPEQLGYDTIANNLSESSVADRRLGDLDVHVELDDLLLCYGDHLGDPVLREAVAAGAEGLHPDDVLVTAGAAAALFCTSTALLEPGDHAVVVRTNYATNLETPRAIGADVEVVDLCFEDGWQLDVEQVAKRVRDGQTRLISVTQPHNPTGTMFDRATLDALVALAERSGAVLLVDETYRDLTHGEAGPLAATQSARVISVSSMSKAYGLPGLRIGWAVCRDPALAELLLAAKEQVLICGATLDEHIAGRVLAARSTVLPPILDDVRHRLGIVRSWMAAQSTFEWVEPSGGVVGLVRVVPEVSIDAARFHEVLLAEHGTYVGPGHWFELDDRHFRLGYGWPTEPELHAGLAALTAAAAAAAATDS
ncbi:MAG: aminotransferase class I/II-fold pyridoxal phosphate-dependent enzyme [Acidimicrobiales bacterium]